MALLKNICQNLNKKLSDIELAHAFRNHSLFSEYLKSEKINGDSGCQSIVCLSSNQPIATIGAKYHELKIQESVYFQRWWSIVRNGKHSTRKNDIIEMLGVIESNECLMMKLKNLFGEYDQFMKLYRKLETLIQKQLFLVVCQHSIVVLVAIHLFMELHLEWGDLLEEKTVKLAKVNFTIHLVQIFHDFGCLALTAIACRNEVYISISIISFHL